MDKFGIFKLLNSFLNLSSPQNGQPNDGVDANSSTNSDLISSLLSSLNSDVKPNSNPKRQPTNAHNGEQVAKPANKPLQRQMLLTINSHDEFVKRVKGKQR